MLSRGERSRDPSDLPTKGLQCGWLQNGATEETCQYRSSLQCNHDYKDPMVQTLRRRRWLLHLQNGFDNYKKQILARFIMFL
eukprot:1769396-Amphidinium_carterae.1